MTSTLLYSLLKISEPDPSLRTQLLIEALTALFARIPNALSNNILVELAQEGTPLEVVERFAKQIAFENACSQTHLPLLSEMLSKEKSLILSS